jgi:hypothetical protein
VSRELRGEHQHPRPPVRPLEATAHRLREILHFDGDVRVGELSLEQAGDRRRFGGDVVVMTAVGMLSGYCGTLMTPMAANYNIVPAALLELPDEYAVIRVQVPTGLLLLAANTLIMYLFVYRH